MLTTIIAAVVVLGGLIFFHELGHFLVARLFGMGVDTFSLGFGPKLLVYKTGKTSYALSLIPLGGYVALAGENDDGGLPEGFTEDECFSSRPAWQRMLVVLAGPVFNIVLAWSLCWIMTAGWGMGILLPQVGSVVPDGPAAQAGVLPGDSVLRINGAEISEWQHLADAASRSRGTPLLLTISRPAGGGAAGGGIHSSMSGILDKKAQILQIRVTPKLLIRKSLFGEDEKAWMLGVGASGNVRHVRLNVLDAAKEGWRQTLNLLDLTWKSVVKLAQRVIPFDQVGGPIMIAQMVGQQAEQGIVGLLGLAALISINLGVLNLLPIPVLDGGQILFFFIEMIIRRPVPAPIQIWGMRFGLACLITLMVLATYNDIIRLLRNAGWLGGA